jgi:tetratricopeptide (TPR) repeat protein
MGRGAAKLLLPAAALCAIGTAIVIAVFGSSFQGLSEPHGCSAQNPQEPASARNAVEAVESEVGSLSELLEMSSEELAAVDIAERNLLCAAGLPGTKDLDIGRYLATLDRWAKRVAAETERHVYRAHHPRWAEHYGHSEAYLRSEFLLQVLQQDLGVRYDMASSDDFSFADSRVAFLHGMIPAEGQTIEDTPGGTCASMPVLYVAIGRRLGYPLKLVTTDSHVFVRWDGRGHSNAAWRDRFNIEGAGQGFSRFPDEYYKRWPRRLTEEQVRKNRHLISLAAAEETALFLASRAHCLLDNGQAKEAAEAYRQAARLDPTRPCYGAWYREAAARSDGR